MVTSPRAVARMAGASQLFESIRAACCGLIVVTGAFALVPKFILVYLTLLTPAGIAAYVGVAVATAKPTVPSRNAIEGVD